MVMTPDEFKQKMQDAFSISNGDMETQHRFADDLLCDVLKDLGYGDGIEVYESIDKWYT
jgi:hypothetical protein